MEKVTAIDILVVGRCSKGHPVHRKDVKDK